MMKELALGLKIASWGGTAAPTNHETLLYSLPPCSLTHHTIYMFDLGGKVLFHNRVLCNNISSKHSFIDRT